MTDRSNTLNEVRLLNESILLAVRMAKKSKDPSTRVGAVVTRDDWTVCGVGHNKFPERCSHDPSIWADRPRKYLRVIHAEAKAIMSIDHAHPRRIVTTLHPCSQCAALIIETGIRFVYSGKPSDELVERWGASFTESLHMFAEAGVQHFWVVVPEF
jgi:dCMP deaminase